MLSYYEVDVYREALNMILDYEDADEDLDESQRPLIEQAAQALYGLIHARFILTTRGMSSMFEKFNCFIYGSCPLLDCHAQNQVFTYLPSGDCYSIFRVFFVTEFILDVRLDFR